MKKRTENGLVDYDHITIYPGFATSTSDALDKVLESVAEQESDLQWNFTIRTKHQTLNIDLKP
jgi:hypothetical protein